MRFGFFLIIAIYTLLNIYVFIRGWQILPASFWIRLIYGISIPVFALSIFAALFWGDSLPEFSAQMLAFIGYTWMITMIYLVFLLLIIDILRIGNYLFHFLPTGMHVVRIWATLGGTVFIFLLLVIGYYRFSHPSITTLEITVDKPLQNKEMKIVMASDMHLSKTIGKKRLQQYVSLINAQRPDIVMLAGDISDRKVEPLKEAHMNEELSAIRAPLGVYAVSGNHEFYGGEPQAIYDYLRNSGINLLIDSCILIDSSFYLIGRQDRTDRHRKTLAELVRNTDKTLPLILLDHQPHNLTEAEENNIDLQLSGHTHNGQFWPGNLIVKRMFELGYGYKKRSSTHYYVSSGLGIWGPEYRIGTKSEIVVIRFRY